MIDSTRRMVRSRHFILSLAALLAVSAPASGSVLDQEFFEHDVLYGAPIDELTILGQSFTVGVTGLLDRVEIQVGRQTDPTAPLVIEIRRASPAGHPDHGPGGLLATVVADESFFPVTNYADRMTGFDLGAQAVPVVAGEHLAIVLRSDTGFDPGQLYLWATDTTNGYAGGVASLRDTHGDETNIDLIQDSGFRTFVSPVPEPSAALALFAVAACAAGRCRKLPGAERVGNGRPGRFH